MYFNHRSQDNGQLTKFVIGIVRAFLMKHGFAKKGANTTCQEGIQEVINQLPAREKRKRDWMESQLPLESSFTMDTTGSTKGGRSRTPIDPTEYSKHAGAKIIHVVCVSAAQSCS
jgi:hypothetical protein